MRLWVDHLEDLARAARLYETFITALNANIGNDSDLEYIVPDVLVACDGTLTKMRFILDDGVVWLVDDND